MTASVNGMQRDVLVGGFIDRLEKKDDAFWVVDYKTGRKGSNMGRFSLIDNLFDARHIKIPRKFSGILLLPCRSAQP